MYRAERESPLDLTATIPGFPLQQANVFLPDDLIRLSGRLQAKIHAGGTADRPRLDGGVHFAQTEIRVPMIGTSFRLSSDRSASTTATSYSTTTRSSPRTASR